MLQIFASITQRLRFPTVCLLCKQYQRDAQFICKECLCLFKSIKYGCKYCACPLPDAHFPVCGACSTKQPDFDRAIIAYPYEEPLRTLIHQFKYQEKLYLVSFLSQLMLPFLKECDEIPQCLIPVPMHPQRLKQRGFNQAAVLTKSLAKKMHIPYQLQGCQKIINTKPQASLDKKQRAKNLRQAFTVNTLPYQHIALVDDLLTTGNTANELARAFKKKGVLRVDVWCCARAVLA